MSTDPTIDPYASAPKVVICPYCGVAQPTADRCRQCRGAFEALSRQATHNAMGPWFVHDSQHPHRPGCSYETLATMIERGQVTKYTIIRGPTSKQFWTVARHVPGVSHLLGYCHECDAKVETNATGCSACGALFGAYLDRNHLGLPEVRPLPGEAPDVEPEPGSETLGRAMAPPVWRSVSSFAADEELLAPPPVFAPPAAVASPVAPARAAGKTENGDPMATPVVRALKRRVARQQRTIRLLVGLVFVVAVIGAAFNLQSALRERATSPASEVPPVAAAETDVETSEDTPAGRVDDDAPDTGNGAETDARPAEPIVESARGETVTPSPPVDDAAVASAADRQRADRLARDAGDGTRPASDRITDHESALAILRRLAASAADPAEIEAAITRLEDRLERLRLGEFFK